MAAIGYGTDADVEYAMKIMHILVDAGANIIVAGSAVFKGDKADNVKKFLEVMNS